MDDLDRKRYEMLIRVRDFGEENSADFPAGSAGAVNFMAIGTVVSELELSGAAQVSGINASRQGTTMKAFARENLREDLRAITRTARALALDDPGFIEQFRMPRGRNDQKLLATARSFMDDAAPHRARFVEYGLPDDFLDDLRSAMIAFNRAVGDSNDAAEERIEATASIDVQIERGLTALRRLRAIVRNRYSGNRAKLAAWTSASHVEKAPKRKDAPAPAAFASQPQSTNAPEA